MGRLVDIGGYRLHVHEEGLSFGGPTVVLETGSTLPSALWLPVQRGVAAFARVVSYDRAGYGWSESSPFGRTGEQVVRELRALLAAAGVPGPYVMAGHSLGGLYARLFAASYPADVAGMVLVDALQEDERSQYGPAYHKLDRRYRMGLVALACLGIPQMVIRLKPALLDRGKGAWHRPYTPEELRRVLRVLYRPRLALAALREWQNLAGLEDLVRAAPGLGDLPLAVVSRGQNDTGSAELWRAVQEGQAKLAGLSSRVSRFVAGDSGHLIPVEQPEVVVEAIRAVVEQVGWSETTGLA